MPRIEFAPEITDDFERIIDHLRKHEVHQAENRIEQIIETISILENNPLIGRPTDTDIRELIIGRDSRGYVALYQFIEEIDTVFVLAIRGQKEAGYKST